MSDEHRVNVHDFKAFVSKRRLATDEIMLKRKIKDEKLRTKNVK